MRRLAVLVVIVVGGWVAPTTAHAGFWSFVAGQGYHHTLLPHSDHHLIGDGRLRDDLDWSHTDTHHEDRDHHHRQHRRSNKNHHNSRHKDRNGRAVPRPHRDNECRRLQIVYLFRHGVNRPDRLRGLSGCLLWRMDDYYHAHDTHPGDGIDPLAVVRKAIAGL